MRYHEFLTELRQGGIDIGDKETLEVEWSTGGLTGGGYRADVEPYPYESEPEPNFDALDKVLELVAPGITFLQYKRLAASVVHYVHETHAEYYGNRRDVAYKRVLLKELFAWLTDNL